MEQEILERHILWPQNLITLQ